MPYTFVDSPQSRLRPRLLPQTPNMAPPRKKRKIDDAAIVRYPCFSCATDRSANLFPDYNPTPDCEHLINTCKTCLKKWTECCVDDATFATATVDENGIEFIGIKCPQCDGVMRNVNVMIAATKKVYQRYVTDRSTSFSMVARLILFQIRTARAQAHRRHNARMALVFCSRMSRRPNSCVEGVGGIESVRGVKAEASEQARWHSEESNILLCGLVQRA